MRILLKNVGCVFNGDRLGWTSVCNVCHAISMETFSFLIHTQAVDLCSKMCCLKDKHVIEFIVLLEKFEKDVKRYKRCKYKEESGGGLRNEEMSSLNLNESLMLVCNSRMIKWGR